MSGPQRLPDPDVLRKMLESGKTQREIADEFGVTKQAVSFHVRRRNLRPAPPRYDAYIPWRVALEHQNNHRYHMLQAYARQREGLPLNRRAERALKGFLKKLDEMDAVVDYTTEHGFALVPRRPIDRGYVRDPTLS